MFELGAPSEHVRSGHRTKLIGQSQIDKLLKAFQVILVGTSGSRVVQIGKPLDCGRNLGQRLKFNRRESRLIVVMCFRQFL